MNIVIREKDKQIAIIAGFTIIILVDLFFILGWQWRSLSAYFKDTSQKKQDIVSLVTDIRNLDGYKNEIVDLDDKIARLELLIVDEVDVSSLIENISNLADSSGVKITQIRPAASSDGQRFVQAKDAKFGEIEIQIIAKSDFHQFGNFISKIESAQNFFKLSSLEITTDSRNYFIQQIALSLKSFVSIKE